MKRQLFSFFFIATLSLSAFGTVESDCRSTKGSGKSGFVFTEIKGKHLKISSFKRVATKSGSKIASTEIGFLGKSEIENLGTYHRYAASGAAAVGSVVMTGATGFFVASAIYSGGLTAFLLPLTPVTSSASVYLASRAGDNLTRARVQSCILKQYEKLVSGEASSVVILAEEKDDFERILDQLTDLVDDFGHLALK